PQPGRAPGQQQRDGDQDDQAEHGVGQDVGLDRDLARVEQGGQGGQRRAPAGQAPVAQQGVDDDGDGDAHEVLEGGHHQQGVRQVLEQVQQERVAGGPDDAEPAGHGALHVEERVGGQQGGPEGQRGQDPRHQGEQDQDGEQPVVAQQCAGP